MNIPVKIPSAIVPKVQMCAKKNWPTIATVGGLATIVGGTVLACRAMTKVPAIMEEHEEEVADIREAEDAVAEVQKVNPDYGKSGINKWKAKAYLTTGAKLAREFAPAVALEGLGIWMIASAHIEMNRRQATLSMLYSGLSQSYELYRNRVRDKYGDDEERKLYYGLVDEEVETQEVNEKTGRKKKVKSNVTVIDVDPTDYSRYARCFCKFEQTPDGEANMGSTQWVNDSSTNLAFLKAQQNYANDKLHIRGWLALNEVLEMLGFDPIPEGQVIGWADTPEHDRVVDFGIYNVFERTNQLAINQPAGYAPAIMLDFNIDNTTFYDADSWFFRC